MTAKVRGRVDEKTVSVSIPSYDFPHSTRETSDVKHGQELEPNGQVTRIEDEKVTIALGPLVAVDIGVVRLVEKYRGPSRKKLLRDIAD